MPRPRIVLAVMAVIVITTFLLLVNMSTTKVKFPPPQDKYDTDSTDEEQEEEHPTQEQASPSQFAVFETSQVMELLPNAAPLTVTAFKNSIRAGFYNSCGFYRSEPKFVLQGGCWNMKTTQRPKVEHEYKLPNKKWAVSAARTADPNSFTSEFSIQLEDNSEWLGKGPNSSDGIGYTVFGEIVSGFEVVEKIVADHSNTQKAANGLRIIDPVIFHKVYLANKKPDDKQ